MALTNLERYSLAVAAPFLRRIEIACVRYAVYLRNSAAGGARGVWAGDIINDAAFRATNVAWLRWYIIENVAAGVALIENGSDTAATDAEIQSQLETQINAVYPAA